MILVYHLLIIFLQGTPYDSSKTHKKSAINFKWAQVLLCGSPLNAYTIVRAKCPPEWGLFERVRFFLLHFFILFYFISTQTPVKKDISRFGYTTTIGLAQFHEQVLNRPLNTKIKPGRPPKGKVLFPFIIIIY